MKTMIKDDAVIEEVRRVRHEISAACDHNPRKVIEYYMELGKRLPANDQQQSPLAETTTGMKS